MFFHSFTNIATLKSKCFRKKLNFKLTYTFDFNTILNYKQLFYSYKAFMLREIQGEINNEIVC